MYDITAKKIVIPEGTKQIDIEEFKNFENVEEIVLPNSIEVINMFAFSGCKSLRIINLPSNLKLLEAYAFAECESLEEITFPSSLKYLSAGVFRDCKKLKRLNIHNNINYIDEYALYNCESLENFDIPSNVTYLGQMALMGCKKIKTIHIPAKLDTIKAGALALMDSLELITVNENNKNYFTEDDGTVLISKDSIIQYAINCDRQEFLSGYYIENYGEDENHDPIERYQLIYNIADYAFAGAKKLKKIFLPSETEIIGTKAFAGCDNLKELEVYYTPYGKTLLFTIFGNFSEEADIPFEKIIIPEGVTTLCENISDIFKNAKEVVLPSTLEHIGKNVFTKSKYLTKLDIPKRIKMINPNTFEDNILLNFSDFGIVRGIDFNMLQTKTSDDYYIERHNKDNVKILSLNNGTYYVKIDDYNIVKVIFETDNKLENLDVEKLNYKINRQEVIRQNIVKTAQAQVGNTGETYWEWYGFNHRVEWCCVFVSWLAHENGVLNKAIPKFIWVKKGVDFYKEKGWLKFPKEYTPIAGDVIFYDWNNNLVIDHVGIVEKVENGYVYAIEGNVNYKNVARRKLKLSSSFIYAYGVPEY